MNQAALVKKRRKKIQNQRLKQVLYDFYVRLVVFWLKSWAKTLIMKYQFYSVISGPFILILHVKNMSRNHIVTILVCFFFFFLGTSAEKSKPSAAVSNSTTPTSVTVSSPTSPTNQVTTPTSPVKKVRPGNSLPSCPVWRKGMGITYSPFATKTWFCSQVFAYTVL